jgi:hypothetical protein
MTKFGDYVTWVKFDVMADYHVRLVLTDDLLKSASPRLGSLPSGEATAFCYHVKGEGRSYIFLKHDSDEGTVAHECYHIVHRMMIYLGVQQMDDEMIAYHLDHMVEKVYEFKNAIKSSTTKEASDGKCNIGTGIKKSG